MKVPSNKSQVTSDGPTAVPASAHSASALGSWLLALGTALLLFAGCANDPFYVSTITAGFSKEGGTIDGGTLGITISPNPAYKLPRGYGK